VTGTGILLRFMLRRDRVLLPVWIAILAGFPIITASSFQGLYPTLADRLKFAATVEGNTTFTVLYGPARALDTIGGLTAWRTGTLGVIVALMSLMIVVRHTRAEEERGQTELIRAGGIGPRAPIAAALIVVALADIAIAAIAALGLIALGLPAAGSVALGASLGAAGLIFAAVGAVTAQLTTSARAANGLAGVVLGAAFALRAVGDANHTALTWLSPLGLAHESRPFAGERWWPLLLCVVIAGALATLAFALFARRDLGAGVLPDRPGPAVAAQRLRSALALAFRLQRGGLAAWSLGLFLVGLVFGSIGRDAESLVDTSSSIADVLGATGTDITDSFFASVLLMGALIATGYTISAAMRLSSEESTGHSELLLSTALARVSWVAGHTLMALGGSALVLAATGLGAGIGTQDASQIPRLIGAALAQLPAVWVLGALVVGLFGLAPDAIRLAWAALGACFLLWFLGPLLDLPSWVLDLSPYEHVPAIPAADFAAGPLLALTAVAAAITAAGLLGFQRRDTA
jgi:polyether ionophore transport system permease protein